MCTRIVAVLLSLALHVSAGKQCTLCAPGKFKSPEMFFTPCTLCPANTFSAVLGAAECEPCPPFSSSVMGSSRCIFETCRAPDYNPGCVCPTGTTGGDGGPCTACAVGTYKNVSGAAACDNCSSSETSVAGSAACFCKANYVTTDTRECLPCLHGMISRENSAVCFCPNGTALVDGECAQIYSEGLRMSGFISFNSTNNSASLDSLLQDLTRSIAAQYNISESLVQVIFTPESRKLLQDSGFIDVVIMTESKKDLDRIANQTRTDPPPMIENLQLTTFPISVNEGTVVLCGNNEVSVSTTCVCAPGYTRCAKCGKCIPCAPGLAKSQGGDEACSTCTGNTFSRTGAAQCSPCPFSAVTSDEHTSCSCNTAFVFFHDTCTATEPVYLNVTGVLRLPQGDFREAEVKQILSDALSEYLNFSKQFITIIIRPDTSSNAADMNATNASTAEAADTSNSTYSRRRLLYDKPVEIDFKALMEIMKNDKETYEKIVNFTKEIKNASKTIADANGNEIDLEGGDLTKGNFDKKGEPVPPCADGQKPVSDEATKKLICPLPIPVPTPKPEPEPAKGGIDTMLYVIVGVCCTLLIVGVGLYVKKQDNRGAAPKKKITKQRTKMSAGSVGSTGSATFPARMLCPATVSFEYQLLPGQSI